VRRGDHLLYEGLGPLRSRRTAPGPPEARAGLQLRRPDEDDARRVRALAFLRTLIPPEDVETLINGEPLPAREPLAVLEATLPTEVADEEGVLRRRERKATVGVYEPLPGETASLYELGIPVVETGDRWHLDVQQKVPVNLERDNMPPAYLRALRVLVLNAMADRLEDPNAAWVRDAAGDGRASDAAVKQILGLRFGDRRVIHDPSDPEANALAVTKGYTLIHGGMLSAGEWGNVKRAGAALPAGQVTPSPKPYGPGGKPLKRVSEGDFENAPDQVRLLARDVLKVDEVDELEPSRAPGGSTPVPSAVATVIDGTTNQAVVKMSTRKYPGVLLQGDSLKGCRDDLAEAVEAIRVRDFNGASDVLVLRPSQGDQEACVGASDLIYSHG
jgi:hypothetical protein